MTHYTTPDCVRDVGTSFATKCCEWGIPIVEDEMAFSVCYRIPSVNAEKMSGYASALTEHCGVSFIVSERTKEAAFVFIEDQYASPTAAHSRKQAAFPKSLGKSKTFGGIEFPPRKSLPNKSNKRSGEINGR